MRKFVDGPGWNRSGRRLAGSRSALQNSARILIANRYFGVLQSGGYQGARSGDRRRDYPRWIGQVRQK
jgi:hypothetical protein